MIPKAFLLTIRVGYRIALFAGLSDTTSFEHTAAGRTETKLCAD
jgi:hypothetical protein